MQSQKTNDAIKGISESVAFAAAHLHAGKWLSQLVERHQGVSRRYLRENTWELTFDIKEVSDYTLARLCEEWIGPLECQESFSAWWLALELGVRRRRCTRVISPRRRAICFSPTRVPARSGTARSTARPSSRR